MYLGIYIYEQLCTGRTRIYQHSYALTYTYGSHMHTQGARRPAYVHNGLKYIHGPYRDIKTGLIGCK